MLCFLVKPLASNFVLYLYIDPSGWYFFLKIPLQPMGFASLGISTKVNVFFFLIESSPILMALSQCLASGAPLVSKKQIGSF